MDDNDVETTPDYWDCECKENYIHKKEFPSCGVCGAKRDEQPDSRTVEVNKMLNK